MTKKELIAQVFAANPEIMKKDIEQIVDSVLSIAASELSSGGKVKIHNFGIFYVKDRNRRVARNAKTGELFEVPATKTVSFKPSRLLIEAVQNG